MKALSVSGTPSTGSGPCFGQLSSFGGPHGGETGTDGILPILPENPFGKGADATIHLLFMGGSASSSDCS